MEGLRVYLFVALAIAVKHVDCQSYSQSIAVANGGNVTLECDSIGSAVDDITWFRNSDPVARLNDSRLETSLSQLTITSFSASHHTGHYSCLVGTNADGATSYRTCPIHVEHARIKAHSGFVQDPESTMTVVGGTSVFHCNPPLSVPPPIVMWMREGLYINPDVDSRITIMPSGNLYITNTTQEDEGVYRCIAENPVTNAKRRSEEATLSVTEVQPNDTQPSFLVVPRNTTAKVGERVVLECAVSGSPPPLVEWSKHETHFPKTGKVLPTGALVFESITAADRGFYHCDVVNYDEIQAEVFIEVTEPPSFTAPLPDVVNVTTGSTTNITCEVNGRSNLHLYLYHNGQLVDSTAESTSDSVTVSTTVVATSSSDSGIYQCLATNDIGCVQTQTVVMVTGPAATPEPEATLTPPGSGETPVPTLMLSPNELHLEPGQSGLLTCETSSPGVEEVQLLVTHGDQSEYFSPLVFDNNSYYVYQVDKPGAYVCRGIHNNETIMSNEVIVTSTLVTVTSTLVPVTATPVYDPLDVMVTDDKLEVVKGKSTMLECKVSGGNGELNVDWIYEDDDRIGDTINEPTDDGGVLSVLTLNPAYDGKFTCSATSPLSGESLSVSVTVMIIVPPPNSPPSNVTISLLPGHLLVEWQPPEDDNNHLLQGYKLAYDKTGRVHKSARISLPSSARNYTIPLRELIPLADHTLVLWAYSLGGDGPERSMNLNHFATPTPILTTIGYPSCTMDGPGAILVQWEGEGAADILYGCNEINGNSFTVTMATSPRRVPGLIPNCTYTFRVQRSPETAIIECFIQTEPTEVDINVRLKKHFNGTFEVGLQHPSEVFGDDVIIEVSINWGMGWREFESGWTHSLASLDPQQEHQVQLRFQSGQWVGFKTLTLPRTCLATDPPEEFTTVTVTDPKTTSMSPPLEDDSRVAEELGLIYGVIFGLIVVACCVVVLVILVLKYIQMTRRDQDKGSKEREVERDEFRRMSLERSSIKSGKNVPSISSANTERSSIISTKTTPSISSSTDV